MLDFPLVTNKLPLVQFIPHVQSSPLKTDQLVEYRKTSTSLRPHNPHTFQQFNPPFPILLPHTIPIIYQRGHLTPLNHSKRLQHLKHLPRSIAIICRVYTISPSVSENGRT